MEIEMGIIEPEVQEAYDIYRSALANGLRDLPQGNLKAFRMAYWSHRGDEKRKAYELQHTKALNEDLKKKLEAANARIEELEKGVRG